jgi:prepilin-type N-terminal cleavage/methylation domain-containing protein
MTMDGFVEMASGRMRRAFSLVEVMIALAVVVLLGALVMPSLRGMSDSVELKETCEQLSSAVSVCRSEAQRRGTPMELVARKGSDGRVALVGRPAKFEDTSREQQTRTGQVLMVLPHGYSIDHDSGSAAASASDATTADSAQQVEDDPAPAADESSDEEDPSAAPLIVFWASGGASKGSGLYLHTRDGRVMGAEINSFTGMLRLEPVAHDTPDDKAAQDSKQDGKPCQAPPDGAPGLDPTGP